MEAVNLCGSLMVAIHVTLLVNIGGITALKIPASRGRDNDGCEPVVLAAKEFPQRMTYIVDDKRFYGNLGNESKPVKRRRCEIDEENSASRVEQPHDCADIKASGVNVSGVYGISPEGNGLPFNVYCDMETDGGGWTVFQRRMDGSVDFSRNWMDYKNGFGSISSEHWLGNEKIHRLSNQKSYEVRVDLKYMPFVGERYAMYKNFKLSNESGNYKLTLGTYYRGTAGDHSFSFNGGNEFSTYDRDNKSLTCLRNSAWWFHDYGCFSGCNLNMPYNYANRPYYYYDYGGLICWTWEGTSMKIRPI